MASKKRSTATRDIGSLTLQEICNSEEGENYLTSVIMQFASDKKVTPERIVIAAIDHILFGESADEFFANPTAIAYRTENEEEEQINDTLNRIEWDTWGVSKLGLGPDKHEDDDQ